MKMYFSWQNPTDLGGYDIAQLDLTSTGMSGVVQSGDPSLGFMTVETSPPAGLQIHAEVRIGFNNTPTSPRVLGRAAALDFTVPS